MNTSRMKVIAAKKMFMCAAACVAAFVAAAESLPEVKVGDAALRVEAARC